MNNELISIKALFHEYEILIENKLKEILTNKFTIKELNHYNVDEADIPKDLVCLKCKGFWFDNFKFNGNSYFER